MAAERHKGLQPGVPEIAKAASMSANEQIQRERRDRISPSVMLKTWGDYHAALVRAFHSGAAYGRLEGTLELRKELLRESTLRWSAEEKASSLEHELREAQSRLTMTKQELAQVTRRFELYRQS